MDTDIYMETPGFARVMSQVYGENKELPGRMTARFAKLTHTYTNYFGEGDIHFFSTPGRTEIGGNHTDHNHGKVLAAAIDLDAIAVAGKTGNKEITIYSEGYPDAFRVSLEQRAPRKEERGTTNALVRGIAARFKELSYHTGGFNACIASDVLPGSGLSSSAAIEVLIATIFSSLFNDDIIEKETLAQVGQYAENHYFHKPCGLMDQLACAWGGIIAIDFKDPQKPVIEHIPFDLANNEYRVLVVDTGGSHVDLTPNYSAIPGEMKAVARELGHEVCRDITPGELYRNLPLLRKKTGDRAILRVSHFLGENRRVEAMVKALGSQDFPRFLDLINQSGDSSFRWLQNCYTNQKVEEQGIPLALSLTEEFISQNGPGACRVHGGGFAGTILVFLPRPVLPGYIERMEGVFGPHCVRVLNFRQHGTIHLNGKL